MLLRISFATRNECWNSLPSNWPMLPIRRSLLEVQELPHLDFDALNVRAQRIERGLKFSIQSMRFRWRVEEREYCAHRFRCEQVVDATYPAFLADELGERVVSAPDFEHARNASAPARPGWAITS